uniref:protein GOLM2 isoform X2 n=1 Tax=Myxine glutinosa TaxID=7769 RepID=UPI0035900F32
MMGLAGSRRGGRIPPFLIIALLIVVTMLGFKYWMVSSLNVRLQRDLEQLRLDKQRIASAKSRVERRTVDLLGQVEHHKQDALTTKDEIEQMTNALNAKDVLIDKCKLEKMNAENNVTELKMLLKHQQDKFATLKKESENLLQKYEVYKINCSEMKNDISPSELCLKELKALKESCIKPLRTKNYMPDTFTKGVGNHLHHKPPSSKLVKDDKEEGKAVRGVNDGKNLMEGKDVPKAADKEPVLAKVIKLPLTERKVEDAGMPSLVQEPENQKEANAERKKIRPIDLLHHPFGNAVNTEHRVKPDGKTGEIEDDMKGRTEGVAKRKVPLWENEEDAKPSESRKALQVGLLGAIDGGELDLKADNENSEQAGIKQAALPSGRPNLLRVSELYDADKADEAELKKPAKEGADYEGDGGNVGEYEADKQAELAYNEEDDGDGGEEDNQDDEDRGGENKNFHDENNLAQNRDEIF